MQLKLFLCSFLVLLLFSCNLNTSEFTPLETTPACNFYYWKTNLAFHSKDKKLADSLGMKKLYLRYFDVDWSPTYQMPVPVATLNIDESFANNYLETSVALGDYEVVPVVYLTHRVFKKDIDIEQLAKKVGDKIKDLSQYLTQQISPLYSKESDYQLVDTRIAERYEKIIALQQTFAERIQEIQIDYDWTATTKEKYFEFLSLLRAQFPDHRLSCTIRLHQFREGKKAGIPPVDQGMLMCYNIAPPKKRSTEDAIFDTSLAKGYLKQKNYPLALEAALPIFSWGSLFHENQFKGLAAGLSEIDVQNNVLFKPLGQHFYQFNQDTVFTGVYMREGDVVRIDEPSQAELETLIQHLSSFPAIHGIAFFEWNRTKIQQYDIQQIFNSFMATH